MLPSSHLEEEETESKTTAEYQDIFYTVGKLALETILKRILPNRKKGTFFSKIPTRIYNMRSHVGTAFRDTGLSNVWQLGATLDNFARSRPPQAVEGVNHLTFPNLSQTISNYQPPPGAHYCTGDENFE